MPSVDELLGIAPRIFPTADLPDRLCASAEMFGATLDELDDSVDSRQKILDAETERDLANAPMICIMDAWVAAKASGIYAIFWVAREAPLVYIGCTEDMALRLKQHRQSVVAAKKIDENDVFFRFVYRDPCHALSAEKRLIGHYRPDWNGKGFGRRPGASGDRQQPSLWDVEFDRILLVGPEARNGRKRHLPPQE